MNDYEELANAIVAQAAKDYREALKKLADCRTDKMAKGMKQECERFFRSQWFTALTALDGEYLMRKLWEEAENT